MSSSAVARMPLLDGIKAIACMLIVLHHLAFYGPMSEVAYPVMPAPIDWLAHYGRMAVTAFLVVTGFLTAQAFAPEGVPRVDAPLAAIRRRYLRLALPFLAALALTMASSFLARHWMQHDSIPGPPRLAQVLGHVLLNNGLLGQEALSAGAWYVGIDFQLFVMTVTLLWLSSRLAQRARGWLWLGPLALTALTLASLFGFNRNDYWDESALYFAGHYGLGCLAYWLTGRRGGWWALLALTAVVLAALAVDFRPRVVVALGVALLLGGARQVGRLERIAMPAWVNYLARISYSVFLIHFALCLLVSASVAHFFGQALAANVAGMAVAFVVSVAGGALFHHLVESRALDARVRRGIVAGFAVGASAFMLI